MTQRIRGKTREDEGRRGKFIISCSAGSFPSYSLGFLRIPSYSLGLLLVPCLMWGAAKAPSSDTASGKSAIPEEMEVQIKGQFKGRLLVKKIVAPVTMNLEKLQDFPEDPSQKILLDPLPISQTADFNARTEVKGHAPFVPWVPSIAEPPFLRMVPPKFDKEHLPQSWMFEVFNPQGQTIFRQRGTNLLPDELLWEGKDSEKKFAVVDRLYSAQLTLVGMDGKAAVITGDSIILPAMIYGSNESETVELSLARLFVKDRADLSAEGVVLLAKFGERLRELGLTKLHARISGAQKDLSAQREKALVDALEKALHLSPGFVEHDHAKPTLRGEVAVFWLKRGSL
jgi:hypothetical protein